jgi:hypothetical protein
VQVSVEGRPADPEVLGDVFGGVAVGFHPNCQRDVISVGDLLGRAQIWAGSTRCSPLQCGSLDGDLPLVLERA